MDSIARIVVLATLIVLQIEVESYSLVPKRLHDKTQSSGVYHHGKHSPKSFVDSKQPRTHARPAHVGYQVQEHHPAQTPRNYIVTERPRQKDKWANNGPEQLTLLVPPPNSPQHWPTGVSNTPQKVALPSPNSPFRWSKPVSTSQQNVALQVLKSSQQWPASAAGNSQKWPSPAANSPQSWGSSPSNIPQQWAHPVHNSIEEPAENQEVDEDDDDAPAPHIAPDESFPSFGGETPRRGRLHKKPGEWATVSPDSGIDLDFVPIQTYAQVRNTNTVQHLPQSEAVKDATSVEEIINAPRLKEVLRTKKIQEVYSEEGYEDSGYDHAGHERHAEHDEGYAKKDDEKFKIKETPRGGNDDNANEESRDVPATRVKSEAEAGESNLEPKISRSRVETSRTSVEYTKAPMRYKGAHKYSSKIKGRAESEENKKGFEFFTTEKSIGNAWVVPSVFDEITTELSIASFKDDLKAFVKPTIGSLPSQKQNKTAKFRPFPLKSKTSASSEKSGNKTSSKYQSSKFNPNWKPFNASSFSKPQTDKATNKTAKYNRLYTKSPKRVKFESFTAKPPTLNTAASVKETVTPFDDEPNDKRIVLPTIGYINSLTTAHFSKDNLSDNYNYSKPTLTGALDLTEALNFLRSKKNVVKSDQDFASIIEPTMEDGSMSHMKPFEPMKLKKTGTNGNHKSSKSKRNVEENKEAEIQEEDKEDNGDKIHDEKNEEYKEEERKRIEDENREKAKYEKELSKEITQQGKKIIKETFDHLGVSDITDKFPDSPSPKPEDYKIRTTPKPIDIKKYPFYFSKAIPRDSPLRYATNPGYFPRKSGHKMEFYESRDRIMECPDVKLNLDDIPKSNSTKDLKKQPGENPRIVGLGDKITCLKLKYFDEDPLDSPFFRETEINYYGKPKLKKSDKSPGADSSQAGSEEKGKNLPKNRALTPPHDQNLNNLPKNHKYQSVGRLPKNHKNDATIADIKRNNQHQSQVKNKTLDSPELKWMNPPKSLKMYVVQPTTIVPLPVFTNSHQIPRNLLINSSTLKPKVKTLQSLSTQYPVSIPDASSDVNSKKIRRNEVKLDPIFIFNATVREDPKNNGTVIITSKNETVRFHSTYQYHPNRTMQILVREQKPDNTQLESQVKYDVKSKNETKPQTLRNVNKDKAKEVSKNRVIPVKELVDEPPANYFIRTSSRVNGIHLSPMRKFKPTGQRIAAPSMTTRIVQTRNRITIPHNCMHNIGKMTVEDGPANLVIDCKDATLIQEFRNGARHVKILPKFPLFKKADQEERNVTKPQKRHVRKQVRVTLENYADQSDWVPMIAPIPQSYVPTPLPILAARSLVHPAPVKSYAQFQNLASPTRFGRRSDENIVTKNETNQNISSDHYIIDELKEDDTIRKGEVVEDRDHFLEMYDSEFENVTETSTTMTTEEFESLNEENQSRTKRNIESDSPRKRKKSNLFPNKMLLDKIHKKPSVKNKFPEELDLGISSPDEVNQEKSLSAAASTTTSTTTTTTEQPKQGEMQDEDVLLQEKKKFPSKRPLKRLSGRDFLVRYHKNKGKSDDPVKKKADEFWKVSSEGNNSKAGDKSVTKVKGSLKDSDGLKKFAESELKKQNKTNGSEATKFRRPHKPSEESPEKSKGEYKTISRTADGTKDGVERKGRYMDYSQDGPQPTLYYVADFKTGRGKWLTSYDEEPSGKNTTSSDKVESSQMNYGSGKVQKQKIRKNFLKRKSNKSQSKTDVEA